MSWGRRIQNQTRGEGKLSTKESSKDFAPWMILQALIKILISTFLKLGPSLFFFWRKKDLEVFHGQAHPREACVLCGLLALIAAWSMSFSGAAERFRGYSDACFSYMVMCGIANHEIYHELPILNGLWCFFTTSRKKGMVYSFWVCYIRWCPAPKNCAGYLRMGICETLKMVK